MLNINYIIDNQDLIIDKLLIKNFNAKETIKHILNLNTLRKGVIKTLESNKAHMNQISNEIGNMFKSGKKNEAEKLKSKTQNIKNKISGLQSELNEIEEKIYNLIIKIPNIPHESVKKGKPGEYCCEITKTNNKKISLDKNALPHWDLIEKFNLINFKLGNKITSSGFPIYMENGAKLQRALINFFLDENIKAGYKEIIPPLLINKDSGFGTGQIPDKDDVMYYIEKDDLYLIPTAEVPVTNILRNETIDILNLPIKYTSYTPCFRREAGSYGKDVRGLNRIHQFDKVEIVQIANPEKSYEVLEEMVSHVENILIKLELPYRIVKLCGTDLSFASALTYDFEVYSAAQKKWLEVSSVSNFETFQSNRLKIKIKSKNKNILCHTLNGSSLALPRIVAAMIENNQKDNKIDIPKILHKYTGFEFISK